MIDELAVRLARTPPPWPLLNIIRGSLRCVYVLKLENDCWYVGSTRRLRARLRQHCSGKGAWCTRMSKPVLLEAVYFLPDGISPRGMCRYEEMITLQLVDMYGAERVRGAQYCHDWSSERDIEAKAVRRRLLVAAIRNARAKTNQPNYALAA